MGKMVSAELTGVLELDQAFAGLPRKVGNRAVRNALKVAAHPVMRQMEATAPRSQKPTLMNKIRIRAGGKAPKGTIKRVITFIGVYSRRRKPVRVGAVAYMLHYGTPHVSKYEGWITRAVDERRDRSISIFKTHISSSIKMAMRRGR